MSFTSKKDKSMNNGNLYESYQIRSSILYFDENISDDLSESNIKKFKVLNQIYSLAPTKLKGVFGNNLANTKITCILMSLLTKYNNDELKTTNGSIILCLCLSCLWNATDCSEKMGIKLVETKQFKEVISQAFRKCDLTKDMDKQFANSIISIIHNIVRRPMLNDSFKGCEIEAMVVNLAKKCDEPTIKVICLVVLLELLTEAELKQYADLYSSVDETVVCYLDGASNTDDFRCDGFSGKELLDMIMSLGRIDSLKIYFQRSTTLQATFIRFLSKNYQIKLLIDVIRMIYDKKSIEALLDVYKVKNKDHNQDIISGLSKDIL